MTDELDEAVRASLRATAGRPTITAPDVDEVIRRPVSAVSAVPSRRGRALLVAAVAAFVLGAGGLAIAAARTGNESAPASPPTTSLPVAIGGPLEAAMGPGALIGSPGETGWSLAYFFYVPYDPLRPGIDASHAGPHTTVDPHDLDPGPYVEYQFSNVDGRILQVSFYSIGKRVPVVTAPQPSTVTVRGYDGYYSVARSDRFQIDWDEHGRTWEASGGPATDLAAFTDLLRRLPSLSEDQWRTSTPPGLVDAVFAAQAGQGVSWYPDKGIAIFSVR